MIENEVVVNRLKSFKNAKYLIVITEEKAVEVAEESWEGKLNHLRKFLVQEVKSQNKIV